MTERINRVLVVTRNLPPLLGGMERLNQRLVQALAAERHVSVVGPEGSAAYLPVQVDTKEIPLRPLWRFLGAALLAAWREARRSRVDLVFAGSGLTAPIVWLASRGAGATAVVYVHGLDLIVPSRLYQLFWLPFIRRCDLVFVNSANTARLAMKAGVTAPRIVVLHPGTDLPGPDVQLRHDFRLRHSLGERPLLLSVGRLTPRKGLAEFVEHGLPEVLRLHPDALFLIIGAEANNALHARGGGQGLRIQDAARRAGVADAVRIVPSCPDRELEAAYAAADLHVFPVLDHPGDVEGFGMVAVEAAARGLPTVAFAVGGVPDAVVEGATGSLAAAGDYRGLAQLASRWLARRREPSIRADCAQAARVYGWDRFAAALASHLQRLTGDRA